MRLAVLAQCTIFVFGILGVRHFEMCSGRECGTLSDIFTCCVYHNFSVPENDSEAVQVIQSQYDLSKVKSCPWLTELSFLALQHHNPHIKLYSNTCIISCGGAHMAMQTRSQAPTQQH